MRIAIIGGGIGGLVLANLLVRWGVQVHVFERAPVLSPQGAGLTLGANAVRALDLLDQASAVAGAGVPITTLGIDDARGRPLVIADLSKATSRTAGYAPIAIHRARLQSLLHEALPEGTVLLDQELVRVEEREESVVAYFASGAEVRVELLVGADGLRSRVRRSVFGERSLRYSGQRCYRGVCPSEAAPERRPRGSLFESWGRGMRFGYVEIAPGETYWYATLVDPTGDSAAPLSAGELVDRFQRFHAAASAYVDATPPESILNDGLYDLAPSTQWSTRRVVLLGDAIHPTTPNLGQGAGMAIESAVVLAFALRASLSLEGALGTYQAIRRRRTAGVTQGSWRVGKLASWSHPLACAVRDWLMRRTSPTAFARQTARFAGEDFTGRLVALPGQ